MAVAVTRFFEGRAGVWVLVVSDDGGDGCRVSCCLLVFEPWLFLMMGLRSGR